MTKAAAKEQHYLHWNEVYLRDKSDQPSGKVSEFAGQTINGVSKVLPFANTIYQGVQIARIGTYDVLHWKKVMLECPKKLEIFMLMKKKNFWSNI